MYFDLSARAFREINKHRSKTAFVASDGEITWHELKKRSDETCASLKKENVKAGDPVLVHGDKEIYFLVMLLSCYRAGLPIVVIDPALPVGRKKNIIQQVGAKKLVNCGAYPGIPVFITGKNKRTNLPGIAYIAFTSGSGGGPKGVLIAQRNLIAFGKWMKAHLKTNQKTVFINQANFIFDIAFADFFGALQHGGTTIFNTYLQAADPEIFYRRINAYRGSHWNSTPSFIEKYLFDKNFNHHTIPSVKQFVLSGELLQTSTVAQLMDRFPGSSVINAYGPTETTIFSSQVTITRSMIKKYPGTLPIAPYPEKNFQLKKDEIVITGAQVGIGYLRGKKEEQKKFFTHGKKISYRSGDLYKVKDNYTFFRGRKDSQVKLNGIRIEPEEINHALEKVKWVNKAVCIPIVVGQKVKRIIAFVTGETKNKENAVLKMKQELKENLPAWMVPSEIIILKAFPYTGSFKIDKQKLLQDFLRLRP